jgi:hypothetical protein
MIKGVNLGNWLVVGCIAYVSAEHLTATPAG